MEQTNEKNEITTNRGGKRPGAGRPRILGRSHVLHMPIPDELWNKLEEYAKENGMTKNAVVVMLLKTLEI